MQIVQHEIQIKYDIIKHVNVNVKIVLSVIFNYKKIIIGILARIFVRKVSISKVLLILQ